jgi:hypothetical protein
VARSWPAKCPPAFRVLHYYSHSQDQNARDSFDRFARAHKNTTVTHSFDPGWAMIRAFA